MTLTEKWVKWEPIEGLAEKYCIKSISDDVNGFTILLFDFKNKNNKLKVFFENSIDAHRSTDESFRLKIIHELGQKYGGVTDISYKVIIFFGKINLLLSHNFFSIF